MGKKYDQIIVLFAVILITLNFITGESSAESKESLVRQKRNIVCLLKLTGLVSNVFYKVLKGIGKLDPLVVGSLMSGMLEDVTFQGLSSLRNDSNIDVYCQDEMVILNTFISLRDVAFSFKWSQKVLLLTLSGTITVSVENIQFHLEGNLNMNDGIVLNTDVELTKLDGIEFGVSGLGPLNPVIKVIGNTVLSTFQREVETALKSSLQTKLSEFQMSF